MTSRQCSCDFCGLPIPGLAPGMPESEDGLAPEPLFCCYGCRFASAVTRERGETGAVRWTLLRLGLSIFLSMNVMAFTMALWTVDVYPEAQTGNLVAPMFDLFRYLCLLFTLPVVILLGGPLLDGAWRSLRRGLLSTDLLLLSGIAAAFLLSAVSVFRDHGPIYFEVACVILVMVTLGRWFEASGRLRAGAALDELQRLLPEFVRVIRDGRDVQVAAAKVVRGDHLRVLPGERFPTDGRLIEGRAAVDQQILTGESQPVICAWGDEIFAGTLNLDGAVVVETTSDPGGGSLDRLIAVVRQARETRGYYQELADRISAWVFPAVATIAIATLAWHWVVSGFDQGVTAALAVVLVACPCALGLATPLAAWSALGAAARRQVLFRNGQALERLAGIKAVRFDKTGTLTTGQVQVVTCVAEDRLNSAAGRLLLARAGGLAGDSLHPFSQAVREFALSCEPATAMIGVRQLAGRGLTGCAAGSGETVSLGSLTLMREQNLAMPELLRSALASHEDSGRSLVCVGWGNEVRAVFLLEETLRSSTIAAVADCRRMGLDVAVLTGDHRGRAARLAAELGVPVLAELLPEQKLAAIREAQTRIGPVAMVGDGINDAPALAASDVGVALGCGADVSRDAAQVCLLSDDMDHLVWAIGFAREAVKVMRRNLFWAFSYNIAGVSLAASGCLNPALAALLMVISSVLVVRSALRLQGVPGNSSRDVRDPIAVNRQIDRETPVSAVQA